MSDTNAGLPPLTWIATDPDDQLAINFSQRESQLRDALRRLAEVEAGNEVMRRDFILWGRSVLNRYNKGLSISERMAHLAHFLAKYSSPNDILRSDPSPAPTEAKG